MINKYIIIVIIIIIFIIIEINILFKYNYNIRNNNQLYKHHQCSHNNNNLKDICKSVQVKHYPSIASLMVNIDNNKNTNENKNNHQGKSGGHWNACTHLMKYGLNLSPYFMRALAFYFKPTSALEFGCGLGTTAGYLARFTPNKHGCQSFCIEPEPMLKEVFAKRSFPFGPKQIQANFVHMNTSEAINCYEDMLNIGGFDLVYTLEVLEHINKSYHQIVLNRLSKLTKKFFIISAARPDQFGHGHIGGRSRDEWLELCLKTNELVYLPKLSASIRRSAYPDRAYDIGMNVLVFHSKQFNYSDQYIVGPHMFGDPIVYPWDSKMKVYGNSTAFDSRKLNKVHMGDALWPELSFYLIRAQKQRHLWKCISN